LFSSACQRIANTSTSNDRASVMVVAESAFYNVHRRSGALLIDFAADVVNNTDAPRYVGTCGDHNPRFQIEARAGGKLSTAYRPICPLEQSPPIVIPTHTTRRLRIVASESPATPADSISAVWKGGTYRLVLAVFSDYDESHQRESGLVPIEHRASPHSVV